MPALRAGELAGMKTAQEWHMMDTCQVLAYSQTPDAYNIPSPTYTAGSTIACGLGPISFGEVLAQAEVPAATAEIRLPIATVITSEDRIRMIGRLGTTLGTPEDYEIVGNPRQGPSGIVAQVKRITE